MIPIQVLAETDWRNRLVPAISDGYFRPNGSTVKLKQKSKNDGLKPFVIETVV